MDYHPEKLKTIYKLLQSESPFSASEILCLSINKNRGDSTKKNNILVENTTSIKGASKRYTHRSKVPANI